MSENIVARPDWDKAQALFQRFKYDDALPYFLAEAGRGDANALYHAGICYENHYHLGGKQKKRRALECYRRAAAAGCTKALCELGHCYREGRCGVSQDIYKALEYYRRAAEGGDSEGYEFMGMVYEYGEDDLDNWEEALRCYSIAAEMGGVLACTELAKRYAQGRGVPKDHAKTAYYYGIAARKGVNDSRYMLGCCYRDGYGVEVDAGKAFELFHLVGMNPTHHDLAWGHAAWVALGRCYEFGSGTEMDLGKAVYWYQEAADQEIWEGVYELGRCWEHGIVVPRDMDRALYLYGIAERWGVSAACFALARYYEGEGADPEKAACYRAEGERNARFNDVFQEHWEEEEEEADGGRADEAAEEPSIDLSQDSAEAFAWSFPAAEAGDAAAQMKLARAFDKGVFLPRDAVRARYWYSRAAAHGVEGASGLCMAVVDDPPAAAPDYRARFQSLQAAAGQGDMGAVGQLGWCHLKGRGVRRSARKAARLFRKAAEAGDVHARYGLGVCYLHGCGVEADEEEGIRWLRLAAKQRHAAAWLTLARCLVKRKNMPDLKEGLHWYMAAALEGCAVAEYEMGDIYESGQYIYGEMNALQDIVEGRRWIRRAMDHGCVEAICSAASGCEWSHDEEGAARWYRLASEMGCAAARQKLENND